MHAERRQVGFVTSPEGYWTDTTRPLDARPALPSDPAGRPSHAADVMTTIYHYSAARSGDVGVQRLVGILATGRSDRGVRGQTAGPARPAGSIRPRARGGQGIPEKMAKET